MAGSSQNKNVSTTAVQPILISNGSGVDLKTFKTIRIAVTGDVPLNRLETAIIDTTDFQRLRHIKQLGSTYFVYPTALHTRFDHSLGTLGMAMDMIRAIRENRHSTFDESEIADDEEQLIRLLALLHDIGHVPFGHTLEDEFCIFDRHDEDKARFDRFLGSQSEIGNLILTYLGRELYDRFTAIYLANKRNLEILENDAFIYDLVNNTVCADLLDYLRRDSYFCNLSLDMEYRFLKYLYLRREGNTRRVVVRLWKEGKATPRRDIISELIRLLENRYLLGERVYFHHAKLVTGTMIAGAANRAKRERKITQEKLYELGDETLLYELERCGNLDVKRLMDALKRRRLWKPIFERGKQEIDAEQQRSRDRRVLQTVIEHWWKDADRRAQEEDRSAGLLNMAPGDLLIHCPSDEMAMKLAEVKVFWNGELKPLRECNDDGVIERHLPLILDCHKKLWAFRAFINPERIAESESVQSQCRIWLAFRDEDKQREQTTFYRSVVDRIASDQTSTRTLSHDDYEKCANQAVGRLAAHTSTTRSPDEVKRIVYSAFNLQ